MIVDLIAFLRARYDDDERDSGHWAHCPGCEGDSTYECDIEAARAWILREVEAKRRILDYAESAAQRAAMPVGYDTVARLEKSLAKVTAPELERVIRLLALPYAEHPSYRDEWRP